MIYRAISRVVGSHNGFYFIDLCVPVHYGMDWCIMARMTLYHRNI
jgi:hypothetical protein